MFCWAHFLNSWSGTRRCCLHALLVGELRVQQHQALVHDLQRVSHRLIVVLKLIEDVLSSPFWQLDQQWLWALEVVCCDEQMCVVAGYLHNEVPLAELLRLLVEHDSVLIQRICLSDDRHFLCVILVAQSLILSLASWWHATLTNLRERGGVSIVSVVQTAWFCPCADRCSNSVVSFLRQVVVVVLHLVSDFALEGKVLIPFFNWISCSLPLKSLQYVLIFNCNFHQIFAALVSIQTFLISQKCDRSRFK